MFDHVVERCPRSVSGSVRFGDYAFGHCKGGISEREPRCIDFVSSGYRAFTKTDVRQIISVDFHHGEVKTFRGSDDTSVESLALVTVAPDLEGAGAGYHVIVGKCVSVR